VPAWGSDTGGEFSGPLRLVILLAAEGPRTVAEASPPAADAHERMANSEFATSVGSFDGQLAAVLAGGGCGRLTFRPQV